MRNNIGPRIVVGVVWVFAAGCLQGPTTERPDPVAVDTSLPTTELPAATAETGMQGQPPTGPVSLSVELTPEALALSWESVPNATGYVVHETLEPHAPPAVVTELDEGVNTYAHDAPLFTRLQASYAVEACNAYGCVMSAWEPIPTDLGAGVTYIKSADATEWDYFGDSVALSKDGTTMAVGATGEDGENGLYGRNGAVYVFAYGEQGWEQQARLRPSNPDVLDLFGGQVALSNDGNLLVVGTEHDDSADVGLGQDGLDNDARHAGSASAFRRDPEGTWSQVQYIKASNPEDGDRFGTAVAVSGDGTTVAIGATWENGASRGINQDDGTSGAAASGAVYVFSIAPTGVWNQQAYIKASNGKGSHYFGGALALDETGDTLLVGASGEGSDATGVNGQPSGSGIHQSGAAYLFTRDGTQWQESTYLKATDPEGGDQFGWSVALSGDGRFAAIGANVGGKVFVFAQDPATDAWAFQHRIASDLNDFGSAVDLDDAGQTLAVGTWGDTVSIYTRQGDTWSAHGALDQPFERKALDALSEMGRELALSGDGQRLAITDRRESGGAIGIDGDPYADPVQGTGSVYVY